MLLDNPPSERELLSNVVRDIEGRLQEGWDVTSALEPASPGPDALLIITSPDGASTQFVVEAKANLDPRNALLAVEQLRKYRDWLEADDAGAGAAYLVISPF